MEKKKHTIPPKEREEWKKLVLAQIDHRFQNFVLQIKSDEFSKKISDENLTVEQAVDEIYVLCEKYALAVQNDFKQIFKTW